MALLYFKTRPKKVLWTAEVYRRSESTFTTKTGSLSKLDYVGDDVLEKIDDESGKILYRLIGLNRTTPAPSGDCIIRLKDGKEKVKVLLDGENATLLKSGYDYVSGLEVFNPIPYDRMNLVGNNIQVKKNRIKQKKDILTAITPLIVVGIGMMGLVAVTYFLAGASIDVSENFAVMQGERLNHEKYMAEYNRETMLEFRREINSEVEQLKNVEEVNKPQSIE